MPATRNTATGRRNVETAGLTVGTEVIMCVRDGVDKGPRHTSATPSPS